MVCLLDTDHALQVPKSIPQTHDLVTGHPIVERDVDGEADGE